MGIYVHHPRRIRRSVLRLVSSILFDQFRRSLLVMDGHTVQLYHTSRIIRIPFKEREFPREKTYDTFLLINGIVGPVLLGIAVGSFFTGSDFIVDKGNLTTIGSPVISSWTNDWHGLEAILDVRNLLLGFTVLFLARTQGALYFMNNIKNDSIFEKSRKQVLFNGVLFVILFLSFVTATLLADGYEVATDSGIIAVRPYKYFFNFVEMPWVAILF